MVPHNMPQTYATSRLTWRPLMVSDAAFIYRQFSDPDMCRYFSEPACTYAEAQDIITFYRTSTGGRMRWLLCDIMQGNPIGTCGFHFLDTTARQVEIGYDIWKAWWQRGYMRDALPGLVHLCATYLPIDTIYALIDRDNTASIAVVRSMGFVLSPACRALDTPTQHCFTYTITRL